MFANFPVIFYDNDRIYFGGLISRPRCITRFMRQNQYWNQDDRNVRWL